MARYPTLDQIERRPDGPQTRPRPLTGTQRREGRLGVIGTWWCWCGERRPHDWAGKSGGALHPQAKRAA